MCREIRSGSPKRFLPFIVDDGTTVADSTLIRRHIERKYGIDFDASLSFEQKAISLAVERMCEDHLFFAMLELRWLDTENFANGLGLHMIGALPAPARPLAKIVLRGMRQAAPYRSASDVMIDLYTAPTPNGWKVSIALEERGGVPYAAHLVNILEGEQKRAELPAINSQWSNSGDRRSRGRRSRRVRIRRHPGLSRREDRPPTAGDAKGRSLVIQWLMFQMAGVGPMMGQAKVVFRYFPQKLQPTKSSGCSRNSTSASATRNTSPATIRHRDVVVDAQMVGH